MQEASVATTTAEAILARYDLAVVDGKRQHALAIMLDLLRAQPESIWLDCARSMLLRGSADMAEHILTAGLDISPESSDLSLALAGIYKQSRRYSAAEALLRSLLAVRPDHAGAGFLLARMLHELGRPNAAAATLRSLFRTRKFDVDLVIQAVELLDEAGRQVDAVAICEDEIASGVTDARLHAYAGMLHIQLGGFSLSRKRYLYALKNDARTFEWNVPVALSSLQRYESADHEDFGLFHRGLAQTGLDGQARTSLLFALGKAHDDVGGYAQAADYLRQANASVRPAIPWSRKKWQQGIESRLKAKPKASRTVGAQDWAPLFIVGVPRSGTTLIAELLSRHPDICNRGELPWLPKIAQQIEHAGHNNVSALKHAASAYQLHLLQDDGVHARWFIDKEPLNLLRVDLIMAMYPGARVIFCQRNARDIALSLWSQYFASGTQGYAYNFADIAAVIRGCRRMMSHWLNIYGHAIQVVNYEELTLDTAFHIGRIAAWLGLPEYADQNNTDAARTIISTGSLWQARQPVYGRSVNRWRSYLPYVPELLRIAE